MASIFISYSRSDKAFVQRLTAALKAAQRDYWLDENDIPPSAAWRQEIADNIALADTFLYILSPDSIAATSGCAAEVEEALRDAKHIVPLVCREVATQHVRPEVAALNWIYCRLGDDFDYAFAKLLDALDTDLDYWHEATQYLVRARQWEAKRENASFALRGSDLAEAENWLAKGVAKKPAPTPLHVQYITASRRAAQHQQRRTISFLSVISVVMAVLAVAALLFFNQARLQSIRAAQQRDTAVFRQLLASSAANLDTAPDLALLDAVEATKYRNDLDARTALFTALDHNAYFAAVLQNGAAERGFYGVTTVAFSADGQTLMSVDDKATGTGSADITLWSVETRLPRYRFVIPHSIDSAAFSPNGQIVATGEFDGPIELWEATTGKRLTLFPESFGGVAQGLAFSPDGTLLASQDCPADECLTNYGSYPDQFIVWNVASRSMKARIRPDFRNNIGFGLPLGLPVTLAFSPDDKYLAINSCVGSSTVLCGPHQFILWNVATASENFSYTGVVDSFAFDGAGRTLAISGCVASNTCGSQGQTQLVDVASGALIGEPFIDSAGSVREVALSPSGQSLVTAAGDHTLRVWNVAARTSAELFGHSDTVIDLTFSPDGEYFASGGLDNRVLLWRLTPFTLLSHVLGPDIDGSSVAVFSPDGKVLATGNCKSQVSLWSTATGVQVMNLDDISRAGDARSCITQLAFSPDGKRLAAMTDSSLVVVNLASPQQVVSIGLNCALPIPLCPGEGPAPWDRTLVFSPDGHYLLIRNFGYFAIWDVKTGVPTDAPSDVEGAIATLSLNAYDVAFSPDGSLLAAGSDFNDVNVLDGHNFEIVPPFLRGPLAPDSFVAKVAFSQDGKTLAALSTDGMIRLWRVHTGILIGSFQAFAPPSKPELDFAASLTFSPDSQVLAANLGQTFGMWYTATREPVIELQHADALVSNLAFSPDGRLLAEATEVNTLYVRYATLSLWQTQACTIANRNFTRAEWRQIFDTDPYQTVCPNLPVPSS